MTDEQLGQIEARWRIGDDECSDTDLRAVLDEVRRLRRDCAEAYQVIGILSGDKFNTPSVQRALDNLDAAISGEPRPHNDLLPWPDNTKLPLESICD